VAQPLERLVNLALYLAAATGPVSAATVRAEVCGYPPDQDEAAFLRMFERDKDDLRRMGFSFDADEAGRYRLDASATYATSVELTPAEVAAVRVAGSALLADPSFPYAADLRLALAKVAAASGRVARAAALTADEEPERQAGVVAALTEATDARKTVRFAYTNARGETTERLAEPFGLFTHDGRWYLVARDTAKGDVRTFAVGRMADVEPNRTKPRTPDFERPEGFDVADHVALPFQIGEDPPFTARVWFSPESAWRAPAVTAGRGQLTAGEDGSVTWLIDASSPRRLASFVVENGPGLRLLDPTSARELLTSGLREVVASHG